LRLFVFFLKNSFVGCTSNISESVYYSADGAPAQGPASGGLPVSPSSFRPHTH
jgi:hypothetical protein